ncbi:MAG TPA: dihydroxyacetone kinase subunit DhaL [Candidatus Limnocylindrales bacterium]
MTAGNDDAARRDAVIVRAWLIDWAAAVAERRTWLTDLDAAIGDGDHGINLERGLAAVAAALGDATDRDATGGEVLAAAGRRLMGVVGGASGALYGRALVQAGEALRARPDPDTLPEVVLAAAIDAISSLGKAEPGDKTMLDALVPALAALRSGPEGEAPLHACVRAAAAAGAGADATVPLVARKGRASYLGDRSAGHRDPGAASSALLVRSLARAYARP